MLKPDRQSKPFEILLVEDNIQDVHLLRIGLETAHSPVNLTVVTDGEAAIKYFLPEHRKSSSRPDLLLLDLNLPKRSGYEVLAALRENPETTWMPVLILSSSSAAKDIRRAYELHANGYIQKPGNLEELTQLIAGIEAFWLSVAKLPS